MSAPATNMRANPAPYTRPLRGLAIASPVALLALIILGGIVRVSGSGLGCPGWPLCYGRLLPPGEISAIIEFSHRFTAVVASSLVVSLGVTAVLHYRHDRSILVPALAACGVLVIQVVLGAVTVFMELSPAIVAIHLGTGLILLACVLTVTTNVLAAPGPARLAGVSPALARLALAVAGGLFVVVVLGAVVTAQDASLACDGWPLCGNPAAGLTLGEVIQMAHRSAVLASSILIGWLVYEVWRVRSGLPEIWSMTVNLAGLFAAQALVGGLNVLTRLAAVPRGVHIAFGSMVWGLSVIVAVLALRHETSAAADPRAPNSETTHLFGFHHERSG